MAKKKTTEAINREQEAMEEKEALPSFFTNLFSSAVLLSTFIIAL